MNIAEWSVEHTRRFGADLALIEGDWACTNTQLFEQSARFAQALLALGARPGQRVVVALSNCSDLYIAANGTYFAGMVLVVCVDHSEQEVIRIVRHSEASVLVATGCMAIAGFTDLPNIVRIVSGQSQTTEASWLRLPDLLKAHSPLERPVPREPSDLAQLCYTSGTTDRPRAAVCTHAALDAFLRSRAALAGTAGNPVPILVSVPPTAFGARHITMRVTANCRHVLLERFEPSAALAAIETHRIEALPLLPTMAEQLIAARSSRKHDLSSLRTINISGAHVSRRIVDGLKLLFSRRQSGTDPLVVVHYGMTETGGGIASSETGGAAGNGNVGRILQDVEVEIRSPDGAVVAPGEVGEIVARTPYAASGYWNDPERSAAVFRSGFVHTGDLGFFTADGELALVGRLTDVIVQGGCKIIPRELERVIEQIPGVASCAIIGMTDALLGEEAVACVVRNPGSQLEELAIFNQCATVLERRKLPGQVLFFDELPHTTVGKVDTKRIKSQVLQFRAEAYRARRDAVMNTFPNERRSFVRKAVLREIEGILDRPCLEADSPPDEMLFGEAGLDSLGAVRLAHRLSEVFALPISATEFYTNPTLASLCKHLEAQLWGVHAHALPSHSGTHSNEDPVVIVGIGCRVPRARGPEAFWNLIEGKTDAIGPAPHGREPANATGWSAGFLPDVDQFDARFFRLEAQAGQIDPRHRMALEVTWEACEDAGQSPLALPAQRTGLFLGVSGNRYKSPNPLSSAPGMAAGYVCQFFDLRGPVVSIDTMCSSSLVAVHYAVSSLLNRECDIAIAGGMNLLAEPPSATTIGIFSPDGRTRAFAADSNGFGQGEGCVLFVLKRLSQARFDRDRVYAAILSTAINHDGRSTSLTAPNPHSQSALIRHALQAAKLQPDAIQYVEAHGTGTPLGDQIELESLNEVFGKRVGPLLAIGSVKTHIGHLEAAAGAAGLAKVAISVALGRLAPSLHCSTPSPHITRLGSPVQVQADAESWPDEARRRIAGISSFGMSGTNAHAIVGALPEPTLIRHPETDCRGPWVIPISARSQNSLLGVARGWAKALDGKLRGADCVDIAYTASCRRAHLEWRTAIIVHQHSEIAERLHALADNCNVSTIRLARHRARLVLVFSDYHSQWQGLGMELLEQEPVLKDVIRLCARFFGRTWERETLTAGRLNLTARRNDLTVFAFQLALTELWRSRGVEPDAVVGHGLGEIAAACAAGVLSLEEGCRLASTRPQAIERQSLEATLHYGPNSQARQPKIPFISVSTGEPESALDGEHWHSHMPGCIRLDKAVRSLVDEGYSVFLEIGASPHLQPAIRAILDEFSSDNHEELAALSPVYTPSTAQQSIAESLGHMFCLGVPIDWCRRYADVGTLVSLPTYAWDHATHWYDQTAMTARGSSVARRESEGGSTQKPTFADDGGELAPAQKPQDSAIHDCALFAIRELSQTPAHYIRPDTRMSSLGIDSLGIIEILSRVASELGVDLDSSTFPIDPTFAELLTFSTNDKPRLPRIGGKEAGELLDLKVTGLGPLHVWLHPAGGGIGCYRALANALPYDSVAIEAHLNLTAARSVYSLAACYLDIIERHYPGGPIVLGGWSFGGLLAYEMAIQLQNRAGQAASVILIDSFLLEQQYSYLPQRLRAPARPGMDWLRTAFESDIARARTYRPARYQGAVLSIRASKCPGDPDASWRGINDNLAVATVEADHHTILQTPALDAVVCAVRAHCDAVGARSVTSHDERPDPSASTL